MAAPQAPNPGDLNAVPGQSNYDGSLNVFPIYCEVCIGYAGMDGSTDAPLCEGHFLHRIRMVMTGGGYQAHAGGSYAPPSIPQQIDDRPRIGVAGNEMMNSGAYSLPASQPIAPLFTSSGIQPNSGGLGGPAQAAPTTLSNGALFVPKFSNLTEAQHRLYLPPTDICICMSVTGDDYLQINDQLKKQWVGELVMALDVQYASAPDEYDQKERDAYKTQQDKAFKYVQTKLAQPYFQEKAEHSCWDLIERVLIVHSNGIPRAIYEVAEKKIDKDIKCSERALRLIQVVKDNKLIAKDVIDQNNVEKMAAGPEAYCRIKGTYTTNNVKRKTKKEERAREGGEDGAGKAKPKRRAPKKAGPTQSAVKDDGVTHTAEAAGENARGAEDSETARGAPQQKRAAPKAKSGKRKKSEVDEDGKAASQPTKKVRRGNAANASIPDMGPPANMSWSITTPKTIASGATGHDFQAYQRHDFQAPFAPMQAPPMNGLPNSKGKATPHMSNHPEPSVAAGGESMSFDFGSSPANPEPAGGISSAKNLNTLPATSPAGFGAYGPSLFALGDPYDPPSTTPGLTSASHTPHDSSVTPQGASPYGGEATGSSDQSAYGSGATNFGNFGHLPTMGAMQDADGDEFFKAAMNASLAKGPKGKEKEHEHEQKQASQSFLDGVQDSTIDSWLKEMGESFGNNEFAFNA